VAVAVAKVEARVRAAARDKDNLRRRVNLRRRGSLRKLPGMTHRHHRQVSKPTRRRTRQRQWRIDPRPIRRRGTISAHPDK
jgi:hypothetical protein